MPAQLDVIAERYAVESRIGRGRTTEVWSAIDQVLGRRVAIKMPAPGAGDSADFLHSARNAARLSDPNVVAIFDTGRRDERGAPDYVVMEFCRGGTLESLLDERTPSASDAIDAGLAMARALAAAHSAGLTHGALSPRNVLISDDGRFKVADFTGRQKHDAAPGEVPHPPSPDYADPNAAEEVGDEQGDIYALGAVLFHVLTGRRPGDGAEASIRALRPGVPKDLETIVKRCMDPDPGRRFTSAGEVVAALERVAPARAPARVGRPATGTTDGPAAGSDMRWARSVALIIAVGAAAALALGIALDEPTSDSRVGRGSGRGPVLPVQAVADFDPGGDGSEHPEDVGFVVDGNAQTEWRSEQYEGALEQVKLCCKGVGLLFDLGRSLEVGDVEVLTTTPGFAFELRTGDDRGELDSDFETVERGTASARTALAVEGSAARFWLVWITSLPGPTGSVAISEVTFVGT